MQFGFIVRKRQEEELWQCELVYFLFYFYDVLVHIYKSFLLLTIQHSTWSSLCHNLLIEESIFFIFLLFTFSFPLRAPRHRQSVTRFLWLFHLLYFILFIHCFLLFTGMWRYIWCNIKWHKQYVLCCLLDWDYLSPGYIKTWKPPPEKADIRNRGS